VAEKSGEIQIEINEIIRRASKFCHLIKSILWNKDIDGECETTTGNVYFIWSADMVVH
jgi:hypothetical protein